MSRAGGEARALRTSRLILRDLFGPPETRGFAVRFWDGSLDAPVGMSPPFTLVLRHPGALREALLPPSDASMGGAFLAGDVDIEGDLEAAAALAQVVARSVGDPLCLVRIIRQALGLPRVAGRAHARDPLRASGPLHSRRRDAAAVRSHYDVGNDFYSLFLDRTLTYSCAYFDEQGEDLDAAQEAKLELVCRKLRLRPGERFLDIGCGWGGLLCHAAANHGVEAVGITLSEPQARHAQDRIGAEGLTDRCRVSVLDYRDLAREGHFSKIASIGMVEHVGRSRLPAYYRAVADALEPGGLFLNHGIVSNEGPRRRLRGLVDRLLGRESSFMQRFVFPDSELVRATEALSPGERVGLELRDVENLREHYVRTLRAWVRRIESRRAAAVALVGEERYRVWRLYMAASAGLFQAGRTGVIQALWAKPGPGGDVRLPPTRADLYRRGAV